MLEFLLFDNLFSKGKDERKNRIEDKLFGIKEVWERVVGGNFKFN